MAPNVSVTLILLLSSLFPMTPVVAIRKTRLTWVNGIAYTVHHMEESVGEISNLFGGKPVIYCHNPTAQSHDADMFGYLSDLTQAGTQKLGRITEEVDNLIRHLKEAVASVGKNGRVIHIAHSQGALLTFLAARQLSPLEMSQIEVIAFGGAAALRKTPQTPFARCINYYSINDPLLFVVPQAAQALRSGFVADNEFCFLTPRLGDPIRDHNLLGPTYKTALKWEGHRFQNEYQSLVYRALRPVLIALVTVQIAASERLNAILVAVLRPIIRFALLLWHFLEIKLIHPMAVVVSSLAAVVLELLRTWRGEERYVPARSLISTQM